MDKKEIVKIVIGDIFKSLLFALIPFVLFVVFFFFLGFFGSGTELFVKVVDFGLWLVKIVFFKEIILTDYTAAPPPAEFWFAPYVATLVLLLLTYVPIHAILHIKSEVSWAKIAALQAERGRVQAEEEAKALAEIFAKAYTYPNGDRYYGDWQNNTVGGVKHGCGTYWYADGRRYEGGFSNDKKFGSGKAYSGDGKLLYSGTFDGDNCRYSSSETVYFRTHPVYGDDLSWLDRIKYQGQYLNGVKHGSGQWIFYYTQKGDSNRTYLVPKKKSYSEYCQYYNGQVDQNWAASMQAQEQSRLNSARNHWYGN